jgi:hypothetical protein
MGRRKSALAGLLLMMCRAGGGGGGGAGIHSDGSPTATLAPPTATFLWFKEDFWMKCQIHCSLYIVHTLNIVYYVIDLPPTHICSLINSTYSKFHTIVQHIYWIH